MIRVQPETVRLGASALIIYSGVANRAVSWSISGPGTVVPLSGATDHAGQAAARYEPSETGTAIVTVTAGA